MNERNATSFILSYLDDNDKKILGSIVCMLILFCACWIEVISDIWASRRKYLMRNTPHSINIFLVSTQCQTTN